MPGWSSSASGVSTTGHTQEWQLSPSSGAATQLRRSEHAPLKISTLRVTRATFSTH